MRASVGLLLISMSVVAVLSTARQARTDVRMAVADDVAPERVPPEPEPLAPCELAAPPRWIRVADQVAAAGTAVEASENWLEEVATRRPPLDVALDEPSDGDERAAILSKLRATKVRDFRLQEQNLDQVSARLHADSGLDFRITPRVRATRFDEVRITVPCLEDVSVEWLLDNVVTTPNDLRWAVRGGAVTIETRDEVPGGLRLKYFDVKHLVAMPWLRGNEILLMPSCDGAPETCLPVEGAPACPPDPLVELIKSTVEPASWTDEGVSLDLKNGTLIVKNAPRTIEYVGRFLDELRRQPRPVPEARPPPPPPRARHHWDRSWSVVDLVGHASGDGSVAPDENEAASPPYAPGALLSVLRAGVEDDVWSMACASLTLRDGALLAHLDEESIERIQRRLGELRARAGPAARSGEVGYEGTPGLPSNIANPR